MNRMTIYIIAGIIILGLFTYFKFRPKSKSNVNGYFISTQSQSNDRLMNLNLDKASEDASYILNTTKLSFPDMEKEAENIEYKADPEKEWIIDLIQINGGDFKKEEFTKMLDYEWRSNYHSTIYGYSPIDNRWTYANAGGTPDIYSKLQVAIDVQEVYNDENPDFDPKKLERYIIELDKRIKKYPTKLRLEPKETTEHAIIKAKKLVALHNEFNVDAIVMLQSEKQFKGIEMWDALQSIGLTWGDGDLFHWSNNKDYGHDQHFSVWTATEPGYFLPEEIISGTMNPENLIFGFSIPRSADPKNIFDIMIKSAKYCQKRLGGQLVDKNGQPFDEEKEKQYLAEFLNKMENKGLVTGSDECLRMF